MVVLRSRWTGELIVLRYATVVDTLVKLGHIKGILEEAGSLTVEGTTGVGGDGVGGDRMTCHGMVRYDASPDGPSGDFREESFGEFTEW